MIFRDSSPSYCGPLPGNLVRMVVKVTEILLFHESAINFLLKLSNAKMDLCMKSWNAH